MDQGSFDDNELPPGSAGTPAGRTAHTSEGIAVVDWRKGPVTFSLSELRRSSRFRRIGVFILVLAACLVLAGLWAYAEFVVNVTQGSPDPIVAHAIVGLVLLGPTAYGGWRLWTGRPRAYPVTLTVSDWGFALGYPSGFQWEARWMDLKATIWLTDLTGTDLYPFWVPGGFYLGEPSSWLDQIWVPEEAFGSILDSARASGAFVAQREETERGRPLGVGRIYAGTVVYTISRPHESTGGSRNQLMRL